MGGFDWGAPRDPPQGAAEDRYGGRPAPPWPPSGVKSAAYGCCLGCPRARLCAECPVRAWRGRDHDGPRTSTTVSPARRRRTLKQLLLRRKDTQ